MSAIINNLATPIVTVVPQISIGEIMVSADRKSTAEKKLTDAERIRRAVLPANHWGETSATINGERSQSLCDLLSSALRSIANDRLRDTLATDPAAKQIELKDYSVAALLAWQADSAATRGSITFTRDDATNWFAASATAAAMLAKHGAKGLAVVTMLTNRFGALAAKNHGLKDEAEAQKLAAIIDAKDLEGDKAALVGEILARLDHIAKQLKAKAAEATISMDDI